MVKFMVAVPLGSIHVHNCDAKSSDMNNFCDPSSKRMFAVIFSLLYHTAETAVFKSTSVLAFTCGVDVYSVDISGASLLSVIAFTAVDCT